MRIIIFMGLPYQGKTTAAKLLYGAMCASKKYQNREVKYISTDIERSRVLRECFPRQETFGYSQEEETLAWKSFIGAIFEFINCSPTNSILILDGTFTEWSKLCELFDTLTVNLDMYASQRLPLIIDLVHIGSQYGEKVWKPTELNLLKDDEVRYAWQNRCQYNKALGIASRIDDSVFNRKLQELRATLKVLVPTCKHFMTSYKGLIYFARHFLPHHPQPELIYKLL